MKIINIKILIVILSAVLSLPHYCNSQNSWELDKNKEGIKVYTRVEEDSDFNSFKAVMTITASTDAILKILKNADDYSTWYGYTKTSKLLKQEQNVQYNYVETIFPWPYSNRDMVYRMSFDTTIPKEIKIWLKGTPTYIPEKKGIVRMKKAEGYILLKSSGYNTEIIYVFHSEPGDDIPSWLANNSIANLPFKTLSGLRKTIKEKSI
jgi:hypothetical protein